MIPVAEATRHHSSSTFNHCRRSGVDVGPPALGLVLAEEIVCDLDSPPFDKAMMDGYAVRAGDAEELSVIEEVLAGQTARKEVGPGQATAHYDRGVRAAGADAVVMIERTEPLADGRIKMCEADCSPARMCCRRAGRR